MVIDFQHTTTSPLYSELVKHGVPSNDASMLSPQAVSYLWFPVASTLRQINAAIHQWSLARKKGKPTFSPRPGRATEAYFLKLGRRVESIQRRAAPWPNSFLILKVLTIRLVRDDGERVMPPAFFP